VLQYFVEVSQIMPPAEGRRYLAKMQNAAFGAQEGNEQPVSEPAGHEQHH
jgi:hypothetical protein